MPSHMWGDTDFDWDALYAAESELSDIFRKYRIGCHHKEKYGTLRWSFYLFDGTMHSITHPGYVYSQYPKWLWSFDVRFKPLRWLVKPVQFFQIKIISRAFDMICKKYPHILKEIVCHAPEGVLPAHLEEIRSSMWTRIK